MSNRLVGRSVNRYGIIAMLESEDGKIVKCLEFSGRSHDATRAAADYCEAHGLFVTCFSSPETILNDLKRVTGDRHYKSIGRTPEKTLLSQVGRQEALHPRLRA